MDITLPWSKSLTNRNLVLAALSPWISTLHGILHSEDTHYMINALKTIGINIEISWTTATVHGWVEHIQGHDQEIYLWNSWTSTRFLTWLALLNTQGRITLNWNSYMQQRPMHDLIDGCKQLGAKIDCPTGFPPLTIHPWDGTQHTTEITMPWTTSSQYFTALLHIAPLLPAWLTIKVQGDLVSKPYIDLTLHEMNRYGVEVQNHEYARFIVTPQAYIAQEHTIEGDASSLSYPLAYTLLQGGNLTVSNLWSSSKQGDYRFLDIAKICGATWESDGKTTFLQAPGIESCDLSSYTNYTIDFTAMPDVSMTFMILAPFLPWATTLTWLQTLNHKECKRIDAMKAWLEACGIAVSATHESMTIGEIDRTYLAKYPHHSINSYDDHRIAMCFGVLGAYINHTFHISNPACVAKTYPTFWEELSQRQTQKI